MRRGRPAHRPAEWTLPSPDRAIFRSIRRPTRERPRVPGHGWLCGATRLATRARTWHRAPSSRSGSSGPRRAGPASRWPPLALALMAAALLWRRAAPAAGARAHLRALRRVGADRRAGRLADAVRDRCSSRSSPSRSARRLRRALAGGRRRPGRDLARDRRRPTTTSPTTPSPACSWSARGWPAAASAAARSAPTCSRRARCALEREREAEARAAVGRGARADRARAARRGRPQRQRDRRSSRRRRQQSTEPDERRRAAALRSIEATGREALTEMRRLLGLLRSEDEELALAPQPSLRHLERLAESVREAGLPVELEVEGEPVRAAARRRPLRLPDRAGGADQRAQARRARARARRSCATAPASSSCEISDDGAGRRGGQRRRARPGRHARARRASTAARSRPARRPERRLRGPGPPAARAARP